MVILVRTLQDNGEFQKSYPSIEIVTPAKIKEAKSQDIKIKEKVCGIEDNARKKSLLKLKGGKTDIVKLYHYVGTELKPFVESLELNNNDKQYLWGAINFHAKELKMEGTSRLDRDRGHRNSWKNSIKLAGYSQNDAFELDWGNWVELFDTTLAQNDPRIIDWIISTKRQKYDEEKDGSLQRWFRILRKALTEQISKGVKLDTTYLNLKELHAELEEALDTVESDFKSNRDEVAKRKAVPNRKVAPNRKAAAKKKPSPKEKKVSGKGKQTR
jgi:hypothetical protein